MVEQVAHSSGAIRGGYQCSFRGDVQHGTGEAQFIRREDHALGLWREAFVLERCGEVGKYREDGSRGEVATVRGWLEIQVPLGQEQGHGSDAHFCETVLHRYVRLDVGYGVTTQPADPLFEPS